jgi:hypothetical protein
VSLLGSIASTFSSTILPILDSSRIIVKTLVINGFIEGNSDRSDGRSRALGFFRARCERYDASVVALQPPLRRADWYDGVGHEITGSSRRVR